MAIKLDDAHQDLSNAIVVAQATSNQMSKRDPLRPYMNVIDDMLTQMFRRDPSFKPQGGRLGENDMDYDTDEKSMAILRRHLRGAREEYYRYKSEYMACVRKALELEDVIKNYERRDANGWKFVSSFRPARSGKLGSLLDAAEFIWCCILRKQLQKILAILLGVMSVAILLAEATLLPRGVDLSLFSIIIKFVGKEEMVVQVVASIPLMYMCVCTYYSLFQIGMLMFYSLTPRQTSSVNLLMICSMVARYAPPVSYNFLNLIQLDDKTVFEQRMGNIDAAVPFFGQGFNRIYPLIMVIYTILVACNFFGRIINFFGSWKRFGFKTEADDMDGFDPSGLIILQKERAWLEEGRKIGESVIPLARNFNADVEANLTSTDRSGVEMKLASSSDNLKDSSYRPSKEDAAGRYNNSREAMSNKYTAMRDHSRQSSSMSNPAEKNITSAKVSLLDEEGKDASGLAARWDSMKNKFQNFKANVNARKFLPLRQNQEESATMTSRTKGKSSPTSLDEIFQRLKRPNLEHASYSDEDEGGSEIRISRAAR